MVKVDGGGVEEQNYTPTPTPKPAEPATTTPEPISDGTAQKANHNFSGDYYRAKLERSNQTEGEVYGPPTPAEAEAQQAAKEVQEAYNKNANVVVSAPGSPGRDPNQPSAQEAAAKKLRELTEKQSPEVAALTLKYAQPTIDLIAYELGKTSKENDGGYGDNKPKFDNVINDLAAATSKAASAPNGKAVIEQVAKSLVKNISKNDIERFDEALGKPIATGAGTELTAEVINQLKAAGRVEQADDILQNVQDGINQLHDQAKDVGEKLQKYNGELSSLVQQWKPLMSDAQLENAIKAYKDKNPEYVQALKDADRIGVATLRAIDGFGNAQKTFAGLGHADDVGNSLKDLLNDDSTKALLAQSTAATSEVERLMQKADNNPNTPNFFDQVASITGKIDDGKFLTERIFNKALDATIDKAFDAAKSKNYDAVTRQLDRLEKYADKLGYRSPELKQVLKQLGKVNKEIDEAIANGEVPEKAAKNALKKLANKIDLLDRNNQGIFQDGNRISDKFKRFGLVLGAVGTISSVEQAFSDNSALNVAGALVDAVGLGSDIGSALQNSDRQLVKNILQKTPWFTKLPFEAVGKVFGGLSLALDTIGVVQNLAGGKYVDAGLGAASTVGGAMMIFGASAAVTGVGLVIVGAAILGKLLWDGHQETARYEDNARAFLQGAGIKSETANNLLYAPAPVYNALANKLKVDPKTFFTYLTNLTPDKLQRLNAIANGITPDANGVYPDNKVDITRVYPGGSEVLSPPNDLNDLAAWMRKNGYTDAPGL